MKRPTEAQLNDPAWWDRNAPDDAQQVWLVWDGPSAFAPLIRVAWAKLGEGIICGEQQSAKVYQRPTKPAAPEWDGEGLPPVGCECEGDADTRPGGFEGCLIVYQDPSAKEFEHCTLALFKNSSDGRYTEAEWCSDFRPLRTTEQREREEFISWATREIGISIDEPRLGKLYDAGLRKPDAGMLRKGDE